jgi:ABC-type branched-subunit amino acid transport system substrate-binding protein
MTRIVVAMLALAGSVAAGAQTAGAQTECPVKLGAVLGVSGPMGQVGERIAETGQFAVDVFNEAGGVKGCEVQYLLRDTQGQPAVGVDAAKNLVDIEGVPALVGDVSSGVSLPILTSVAVPAKVTQISCCSSSPSFTELARSGQTQGYWFRTYATNRTQAAMGALIASEQGYQRTAVIYVNTDFGVTIAEQFKQDLEKLGGTVTAMVTYNESQPSYRTEVTSALEGDPDSLYLVAFPVDGATITREWLQLGGTGNLVVNNSLRSDDYLQAVGSEHLANLIGYDSAPPRTESANAFNALFQERFDGPPDGPGLHSMFDAVTVVLLAMEASDQISGTSIRDNIRKVTSPDGIEVHPGAENMAKAKQLLADGQTIRYVGATGPFQFDEWGDVSAPTLTWRFEGDQNVEIKYYPIEEVDALLAKLDG